MGAARTPHHEEILGIRKEKLNMRNKINYNLNKFK
jgi:hypothetical protein